MIKNNCCNKIKNIGGVYKITNIKNSKFYIGSTNNFKKRFYSHKYKLNLNKHFNKPLQASWNKYGQEAFLFEIIEAVHGNKKTRCEIEEKYLKKYFDDNKLCFNIVKKTIKTQGPWSKTPDETSKKLSRMVKKRWKDEQYKHKVTAALKKAGSKPTFKEKMSKISRNNWADKKFRNKVVNSLQKYAKKYTFISPEGKEVEITNLRRFCIANNLSERIMRHLVAGTKISYKGYRIKNGRKDPRFKTYTLINPEGKRVVVTNLRKFARDNNIKYSGLQSVVYGRSLSYKGWKLGTI